MKQTFTLSSNEVLQAVLQYLLSRELIREVPGFVFHIESQMPGESHFVVTYRPVERKVTGDIAQSVHPPGVRHTPQQEEKKLEEDKKDKKEVRLIRPDVNREAL